MLGDIHGGKRALDQVLERSGFDREQDKLIFLGDVMDGWPESKECVDELLTIENLVAILGNHDEWTQEWMVEGSLDRMWVQQGGQATIESYAGSPMPSIHDFVYMKEYLEAARANVPHSHRAYLAKAKHWHQEGNRIFLHGGWRWYKHEHPMRDPSRLNWNRELWTQAVERAKNGRTRPLTKFEEVYVGHTTTTWMGFTEPANALEVWNLDQGAGWEGKLSLMNIDTKEFWQSDTVAELYPEAVGRR